MGGVHAYWASNGQDQLHVPYAEHKWSLTPGTAAIAQDGPEAP